MLDSSQEERLGEINAVAYEIKTLLLTESKINRPMSFDYDLLRISLELDAASGQKFACRLLAYLMWLDESSEQNKKIAIEIWKNLAMSGSRLSLNALIHACREIGDGDEASIWEEVAEMIDEADARYSPFVCREKTPENEKAFDRAALILFMKTSVKDENNAYMNRARLYYALYAEESLDIKIETIATGQSCYARMNGAKKFAGKKFGF